MKAIHTSRVIIPRVRNSLSNLGIVYILCRIQFTADNSATFKEGIAPTKRIVRFTLCCILREHRVAKIVAIGATQSHFK